MYLSRINNVMKKLHIIDGSGYIFRAYYGLPTLTDKDGHNVNAVYGVLKMLMRILHEKPDYLLVARDAPVKTRRHEKDSTYKAQRPPLPDDLKPQIRLIKELVEEINLPFQVSPWYEADDIIYTYARRGVEHWCHVTIYSSDKDLKQLLGDNVVFKDPMKGTITNEQTFVQEYWFTPQLIVDYLALIGDSSDNIPWVAGIGPKWALWLIQKYGAIDQIYAHIDQITWSIKEKLIQWKDAAYHSKEMVQLIDVPDEHGWQPGIDHLWTSLNFTDLRRTLIDTYQFHSLEKSIKELQNIYELPQQTSLFG